MDALTTFYTSWEMWDAGQTTWEDEAQVGSGAQVDKNIDLLLGDPGSSNKGRFLPVWWLSTKDFDTNNATSTRTNVSWWIAVPMAGTVTTDWHTAGNALDIAQGPDDTPPVAPVVQRGWKHAFALGQIKVTQDKPDASCTTPGDRRDMRYQYYTDAGQVLASGVTARALHITSRLGTDDLYVLKPSGTQIGNQVDQDHDGTGVPCSTYTAPHLHWEAPGALRGPDRTSANDPETRPGTWAKPGLWDDVKTGTDPDDERDAVDPSVDFVAVIEESSS